MLTPPLHVFFPQLQLRQVVNAGEESSVAEIHHALSAFGVCLP